MRLSFTPLRPIPFAAAIAVLTAGRVVGAQQIAVSLAPSIPQPAAVQAATPVGVSGAGPTLEAASVAVHHVPAPSSSTAARRGANDPAVVLMIVGGAGLLVGLVVGGGAGEAIAIGGGVAGLIGLYQYLQ